MNNKIANSWATYVERVISENAGEVQKIESKRCFYAGCAGVLRILLEVSEDVSEEEIFEAIENLLRECEQFSKDVRDGKE
jgi:hypothetical protein